MSAPIVVHNLEQSRSFRVIWLLEELNQAYTVQQYSRDPKAPNGPHTLKAVHPLGKSPVITDNGNVVPETGAIFDYVLGEYDKDHKLSFKPGTKEQYKLNYWLHYSEGTLMLNAVAAFYLRQKGADNSAVLEQLNQNLAYLEAELGEHTWFVGDKFSAADINLEFPVEFLAVIPGVAPLDKFPRLNAWRANFKKRSAYQKALAANGPYDLSALIN